MVVEAEAKTPLAQAIVIHNTRIWMYGPICGIQGQCSPAMTGLHGVSAPNPNLNSNIPRKMLSDESLLLLSLYMKIKLHYSYFLHQIMQKGRCSRIRTVERSGQPRSTLRESFRIVSGLSYHSYGVVSSETPNIVSQQLPLLWQLSCNFVLCQCRSRCRQEPIHLPPKTNRDYCSTS